MSYKETYKWDPETGEAIYKIEDKGYVFMSVARCHPDEKEYQRESVGIGIAEMRAKRNQLRYIRDNEIKPGLAALEHVFTNMKTSKHFNPRSYEARMIRRQVNIYKANLKAVRDLINYCSEQIHDLSNATSTYAKYGKAKELDKNE